MGVPRLYRWIDSTFKKVLAKAQLQMLRQAILDAVQDKSKSDPCCKDVDSVLVDFNSFLYVAARNMEIGSRALGEVDVPCTEAGSDAARINTNLSLVRRHADTVAQWLVSGLLWTKESTEIVRRSLVALGTLLVALDPKLLVVVALDGPAPAAKRHQQRRRRYRAAEDAKKLAEKYGFSVKRLIAMRGFDGCAVHPGTSFMERVDQGVRRFLQLLAAGQAGSSAGSATSTAGPGFASSGVGSTAPASAAEGGPGRTLLRPTCRVVYSGCFAPGEGEHKMAEWARAQLSGHLGPSTGIEVLSSEAGGSEATVGAGSTACAADSTAGRPAGGPDGAVVLVSPDADLALLGLAIDAAVRMDACRRAVGGARGGGGAAGGREGAGSSHAAAKAADVAVGPGAVLPVGSGVPAETAAAIEAAACRIVVLRTSEDEAPQEGGRAPRVRGKGKRGDSTADPGQEGADGSSDRDIARHETGGGDMPVDAASGAGAVDARPLPAREDEDDEDGDELEEGTGESEADVGKRLAEHMARAQGGTARHKSGRPVFAIPGPEQATPNRSVFEVFNVGAWRRQLPVWMLTAEASRAEEMSEGTAVEGDRFRPALPNSQAARDHLDASGRMAVSSACLDMVMMSSFLGNDFLPLLPGIKLDKRGLQTIAGAWRAGTERGRWPLLRLLEDARPCGPSAIPEPAAADSSTEVSQTGRQPVFRFGFRSSIDVRSLSRAMRVIAAVVEPSVTGSILDGIEAGSDGSSDGGEGIEGFGGEEDDGGLGELLGEGAGGEDGEGDDDGGFADLLREESTGSRAGGGGAVEPSALEACPVMPSGMEGYYGQFAWGLSSGQWTDAWGARDAFERLVPDPLALPGGRPVEEVKEVTGAVAWAIVTSPPTIAWKRLPHDVFPRLQPAGGPSTGGSLSSPGSGLAATKWKRQESDTRRVWSAAAAMCAQWWAGLCFVADYYVDGLRSWDFEYTELYAPLPGHAADLAPTVWDVSERSEDLRAGGPAGGDGEAYSVSTDVAIRALAVVGGLHPPQVGRWWDIVEQPGGPAGDSDTRSLFSPRFSLGRPVCPMDALCMILGPESHSLLPRSIGKALRHRVMQREHRVVKDRLDACERAVAAAQEEAKVKRRLAQAAAVAAGVTPDTPAPRGSEALELEQQAQAANARAQSIDKERRLLRSKVASLQPNGTPKASKRAGASDPDAWGAEVPADRLAGQVGMSEQVLDAVWPDYWAVRVDSESAMRVYDEREFVPRVPRWLAESLVTAAGSDGHSVVQRLWRRAETDVVLAPRGLISGMEGVWKQADLFLVDDELDQAWAAAQSAAVADAKAKSAAAAAERRARRHARKAAEAAEAAAAVLAAEDKATS